MRNKFLAIVMGLMLIAVVGLGWKDNQPAQNNLRGALGFWEGKKEEITQVQIDRGDKKVTLTKKDNKWMVGEYVADEKKLTELLAAIEGVEVDSVASKNPDNHKELDLENERSYKLVLKKGGDEKGWWVGREGAVLGSYYIKSVGGQIAYLAKGSLRQKMVEDKDYWRDKKLVNLTVGEVSKIEVSGEKKFVISKSPDNKWMVEYLGKKGDVAESEVTSVLNLEGESFATYPMKTDTTIRILDGNGQEKVKLEMGKKDGSWWVVKPGEKQQIGVAEYKLSPVMGAWEKAK